MSMVEEKFPFHVQLHLTNRCNLRCKHCYEGERNVIEEWDYNELEKIIQKFEQAFTKWNSEGEISLVGGEPVLYPYLEKVMRRIAESESIKRFAILTNGIYLPDNIIKAIFDTKPTIQISIDGINSEKHDFIRGIGNFEKSLNNIKLLVENGIQVFVHYVISKYTVPITWEFIEMMNDIGVKQITFSRDVPIGFSNSSIMLDRIQIKEIFEQLYDYSRRLPKGEMTINTSRPLWACYGNSGRCPVGIQTLTVLQDGTVYPCRRLPIAIGNLKKDTVFSIWYNSEVLWNLRQRHNIKKCGSCQYLDECGGARCIAYAVTGDYMETDPQCWL